MRGQKNKKTIYQCLISYALLISWFKEWCFCEKNNLSLLLKKDYVRNRLEQEKIGGKAACPQH